MVTLLSPIRTCERKLCLYSMRTARVMLAEADPPRTVTMSVVVPGFWVMVARKRVWSLLSRVIQPVAEGMLIAPLARETLLVPMLGVPLSSLPRTSLVLLIRLVVLVP